MIEVGEYMRTEWGIRKVKKITIEPEVDIGIAIMPEVTALWTSESEYFEAKDIYKHSKNIIDLIEVGDYVNGKCVSEIKEYKDGKTLIALIGIIMEDDIETILTKELYKANCYTVERKEE